MVATRITTQDIKDGTIIDDDVDAANVDGAVDEPSMRTLGTGAQQAAAGDHTHAVDADDAAAVTYTPAAAGDWDGGADPGNVDGALDQLADRMKDMEDTESGEASPPVFVDGETPVGVINSANDTFLLAFEAISGSPHVHKNGIRQRSGSGNDYTIQYLSGDTDLAGGIDNAVTSADVDNGAGLPSTPFYAKLESEVIQVTAVVTNTLTIVRARLGTAAASHADETVLDVNTVIVFEAGNIPQTGDILLVDYRK